MQSSTLDPSEHIAELCELARARITAGDYDAARSYLQAAREEAGDNPSPTLLRLLADLTAQLHTFADGIALMEQALDRFRLTGDGLGEVITAADFAALLQRQGNLGRAGVDHMGTRQC